MKFEWKKLRNSTWMKAVVFVMAVLFLFHLLASINTIQTDEIQNIDSFISYQQDLQDEMTSVSNSLLFNMEASNQLILEEKNACYQMIDAPDGIQKTYELCFENGSDIIFLSLFVICIFYTLFTYEKEEGYDVYLDLLYENKKDFRLKQFLFGYGITLLLYLIMLASRILLGVIFFGYQDVFASMQSVNGMLYCPLHINIITGILMAVGYACIYLLVITWIAFVLCHKASDVKTLVTFVFAAVIVLYFVRKIPFQSNLVLLKILTWNSFYTHMQEFYGVVIMNHVFMSYQISLIWYIVLSFLFLLIYKMHFAIHLPEGKKKVRDHTLFVLEIKKYMRVPMITMLILLFVCCALFYSKNIYVDLDDYYANYYLNALEGKKTEEKQQWLNEQLNTFQELNDEYATLQTSGEMSSVILTRMYEIKSQLNREKGFQTARNEYERSHAYFINTYLIRNILTRQDVLFFILIQLILLMVIFQQVFSFDRKNHIDTLLEGISDYHKKTRTMDQKILQAITFVVTIIMLVRIVYLSDVFVNTEHICLKGIMIFVIGILLLWIERKIIRIVVKQSVKSS